MVSLIMKHFRYSRQYFVIYKIPGIVEYGDLNTETLPLLKATNCDLQNPGVIDYGEFNTETLPLLKATNCDL